MLIPICENIHVGSYVHILIILLNELELVNHEKKLNNIKSI